MALRFGVWVFEEKRMLMICVAMIGYSVSSACRKRSRLLLLCAALLFVVLRACVVLLG
jgi:hypothetical protein